MNPLSQLGCGLAAMVMLLLGATVQAGVVGSQHDLSTGGGAQATTAATDEVCVFCHTPHGSDTAAAAPLWNKVLPATTYTRYSSLNTSSFDSEEVAVGSVSLACLSCHDGTQGMDVVINAPGSTANDTTLYNTAGVDLDALVGAMTNQAGDNVPMLSSDLRDDHPVSMEYAGGGCSGTGATCTTAQFNDKDFNTAQFATINTNPVWWVDESSGTATVRDKTDMLLYTRTFTGGAGPAVECGSCHDPHNDTTQVVNGPGVPGSVAFLRVANTNSQICTTCHIK